MTVAEKLRDAAARLGETSDTARLDAELLMAHALGCTRSELLLRHMEKHAPARFAKLLERRLTREPVAYILGQQEFYGRTFRVTPDVLIPRGDSECVVEAALREAPAAERVIDLGTGTGALLLTLLAELPQASGVGIDNSPAALRVAQHNARQLGLSERADMREADWSQPGWLHDLGCFDLVIANPPYVENSAELAPDVREFEPAEALFAGPEGLDDYRLIVPHLSKLLTDSGVAVIEIGASQAGAVTKIASEHGFTAIAHKDLGGRDRALVLRLRLGKGESV